MRTFSFCYHDVKNETYPEAIRAIIATPEDREIRISAENAGAAVAYFKGEFQDKEIIGFKELEETA